MARPRVLFVCTGNSARSQMAEAILQQLAGDRYRVCSAGIRPKGIDRRTLAALTEAGIPTVGLSCEGVASYLGKLPIDTAITLCDEAREACPGLDDHAARVLHWSFADPTRATGDDDARLAAFGAVRDQIRERIEAWLAEESAGGQSAD